MSDSSSSAAMPQIRRRVIGSNVWILSFGDLVTLLLGFFVSIIASSMRNSPQPGEITRAGTSIAQSPVEVTPKEPKAFHKALTLNAESFEARSGAFVDNAAKSLKLALNFEKVTVTDILVQGCGEQAEVTAEQGRFTQIGRLLATASQLIDGGMPAQTIRIETPDVNCGSDTGSDPVAPGTVKISIVGSVHG